MSIGWDSWDSQGYFLFFWGGGLLVTLARLILLFSSDGEDGVAGIVGWLVVCFCWFAVGVFCMFVFRLLIFILGSSHVTFQGGWEGGLAYGGPRS